MSIRAVKCIGVVAAVVAILGGVSFILQGCGRNASAYHMDSVSGIARSLESESPFGSKAIAPGEELWIISRPSEQVAEADDDLPGCGALMRLRDGAPDDFASLDLDRDVVPVPLRHTDVDADISGYLAGVEVTQAYHNPFNEKIEAVYVFPLPHDAAVHDFVMTVGERRIRGVIREKDEAERIYRRARSRGHTASLMTQVRPNIFTQRVANIEPGHAIDVTIQYVHPLAYDSGEFEWVFPMVVGPRFNPEGWKDPVLASPRGAPSGGSEVQYLAPGERSGHDIAVRVDVEAGVQIDSVRCLTHAMQIMRQSSTELSAELLASDSIPNRDLVLRFRVAGDDVRSGLLTHVDERGGYFAMMALPPAVSISAEQPLELVFVMDCSGSMRGDSMAVMKSAVRRALRKLDSSDTFQIIPFSDSVSAFGGRPVAASAENIARATSYLDQLRAKGGTQMIEGVREALRFSRDQERLRYVCFLTDGFIGNEVEILHGLERDLGTSRIFSFGIGTSPNRYLLEEMARVGRGTAAYVNPSESPVRTIDHFMERVRHPAMTDVAIDFEGGRVFDVYPKRIPDLHAGRPIVVTGRFDPDASDQGVLEARLTGRLGGRQVRLPVTTSTRMGGERLEIASIWARTRIAESMRDAAREGRPNDARQDVLRTALEYNLVSNWTAFIAVDASRRTEGDSGVTVAVPVPVPEGTRYDTTVR